MQRGTLFRVFFVGWEIRNTPVANNDTCVAQRFHETPASPKTNERIALRTLSCWYFWGHFDGARQLNET
jgi:hypothetical protein